MNLARLVTMANDIGHFFAAEPRREDAVAGIADHVRRFWDPRMRRQLAAHLRTGGTGLDELVREALASLPESLAAMPATGPAEPPAAAR